MGLAGLPGSGLYDASREHDACGIGFVANIKNVKSHEIIKQGLTVLDNLTHRGAAGADPLTGDGAGILIQLPDLFFREECAELGIELPESDAYGVGMAFLPQDQTARAGCETTIEGIITGEGQTVLGWRDLPVDNSVLSDAVREIEPFIRQIFVGRGTGTADGDSFERKLFVIRKQIHQAVREGNLAGEEAFYMPTLSARTICFKGMMLAAKVKDYFTDLGDERIESALALVHQRFSTNTFPSWELAQPFRYLCHNGEINTLRGNINWMAARRHRMSSKLLGPDLDKLWPLIADGISDSATFDNALELLVAGGYSLAHAMMLMIPEAWNDNPLMDEERRAFYEYHAALMEPWDGPAAVAFTDGRQIGATLDRNGLRPARYIRTDDDLVIMGSEVGVLDIPDDKIVEKWRLQPGKMFLIDLQEGRIIDDEELKSSLAKAYPYQTWLNKTQIVLEDLAADVEPMPPDQKTLLDRQQAFGYTQEDAKFYLLPMAVSGQDPVGSMGRDIPHAVLSNRPKLLFDYFIQSFAQVTNPPIDPIREELVMSLVSLIGPRPNLLDLESGGSHMRLEVRQPILSNEDLEKIRHIESQNHSPFRSLTLGTCYPVSDGAAGMKAALDALCKSAQDAVLEGYNILILSDRGIDAGKVAIPALLATGAVHHHLIREGLRTVSGLVIETGEARQVHDFCLLAGYGAEAVNPYLAFDTITGVRNQFPDDLTVGEAHSRYIKAVDKGILKVMSKMGISTYQSYCGAQIFDAVGLASDFIEAYFTKTASAIEGVGLGEIARETVERHARAFGDDPLLRDDLDVGGEMAYRIRGEEHVWTPETISGLQHAARGNSKDAYQKFAGQVNDQSRELKNLRGLFKFKWANDPVPLDEVEPASEIVKRFATGAMSFGSISFEAHTNLAIAMNRIGGRSNTGEGGEQPERFVPLSSGDSMRSAIKQVASGRFGVTTEYLRNSDEIQIKMAQGAKPGEGGQLPGHKVDETIARVRHSTPGVGLISPPPHHDIYSIEDLAQLIHDLKNVNSKARISVKLVSIVGVGTIAAGVSKAHADHVLISGADGGTGASPITSVMHAGGPWEIGLAETHQTLVLNKLRGRISVQTDGGIRTGRDVAVAALLGADEMGIATAALIASGCIMMRKCHLNTCPAGIATQDVELRKRFKGQPDHVVNYLFFVAEECREIMAGLGVRSINEMIGRTDLLDMDEAIDHWKANGLDFSRILFKPEMGPDVAVYNCEPQDHGLDKALDNMLIAESATALEERRPVKIETPIRNINRTVGAMLSGEIAERYGNEGLADGTIYIKGKGTGGQSFGAFLAKGITIELEGDANDYIGKGLSGGRLIVYPPRATPIVPEENIVIGNVALYGATDGECYFRGVAGERFAVRNSGATAVVEGVGDHCCEYMTGGVVVVLGPTGRNFAAGMSGGIAYVLNESDDFEIRCNMAMVELEPISDEDRMHESTAHQRGDLETHGRVDIMRDMTGYDSLRLMKLIEDHMHYTDSDRARHILENWDSYLPKFVKVMPVDYRRALLEMQARTEKTATRSVHLAVGD
ncbi:MAG: glutamate synthase large subunit [Rhodospirillales bacterium]|jgi:glutamate synthase (NADPH/NADH) large chain|nr:glutamate synthase large subunit [Rhodospirillales bacterium]MDP6644716.1 glutamate synthase large subunit [Rhodospirillales bacterium]